MFSGEGEKVEFEDSTYPTGNVEEWMLQIEFLMCDGKLCQDTGQRN